MKSLPVLAFSLAIATGATLSARADLFENSDLSAGLAGWHGDGRIVYLAADGTETDDAGPKTTPVVKIRLLSDDSRSTYQEIKVRGNHSSLTVTVDVMASKDYRRVKIPQDTNALTLVPDYDFWMLVMPGYLYSDSNLKIGAWTTVKGDFEELGDATTYGVNFCVPPGVGSVYLKNFSANAN